jgi:hypothetical protein
MRLKRLVAFHVPDPRYFFDLIGESRRATDRTWLLLTSVDLTELPLVRLGGGFGDLSRCLHPVTGRGRDPCGGTFLLSCRFRPNRKVAPTQGRSRRKPMHGLIYLIGLIVVIMFLLSLLGIR